MRASATTIADLPSGVKYMLYGSSTVTDVPGLAGLRVDRRERAVGRALGVVGDPERLEVPRRAPRAAGSGRRRRCRRPSSSRDRSPTPCSTARFGTYTRGSAPFDGRRSSCRRRSRCRGSTGRARPASRGWCRSSWAWSSARRWRRCCPGRSVTGAVVAVCALPEPPPSLHATASERDAGERRRRGDGPTTGRSGRASGGTGGASKTTRTSWRVAREPVTLRGLPRRIGAPHREVSPRQEISTRHPSSSIRRRLPRSRPARCRGRRTPRRPARSRRSRPRRARCG